MSRWIVPGLAAAALAGFVAGRVTAPAAGSRAGGDRGEPGTARSSHRAVEVEASELERLRTRAAKADAFAEELAVLREREARAEAPPDEASLPVGARRADGTIVGGARFPPEMERLFSGFFDSILSQFMAQANLTKDQEARLRDEIRRNSPRFVQITADFVNGDITGDQVVERARAQVEEVEKSVREMLDDDQYRVFERFEGTVRGILKTQLLHGELAGLKEELDLDADQETKVKALLDERYTSLQERIGIPLPNVLLQPIRREQDEDLYAESARRVRQLLSPRQQTIFDRLERQAATAPFIHRPRLVPK